MHTVSGIWYIYWAEIYGRPCKEWDLSTDFVFELLNQISNSWLFQSWGHFPTLLTISNKSIFIPFSLFKHIYLAVKTHWHYHFCASLKRVLSTSFSIAFWKRESYTYAIDHLTQNFYSLPAGGRDKDKQNSSAQLFCVFLSLSHLTAIYWISGEVIYLAVLTTRCLTNVLP